MAQANSREVTEKADNIVSAAEAVAVFRSTAEVAMSMRSQT